METATVARLLAAAPPRRRPLWPVAAAFALLALSTALLITVPPRPSAAYSSTLVPHAGYVTAVMYRSTPGGPRPWFRGLDGHTAGRDGADAITAMRRAALADGAGLSGTEDPSLVVTTNVVLSKPQKKEFLVAASRLLATSLGKPESYCAVAIHDGVDMIFGGSDAPLALCQVVSLGAINLNNNRKVSAGLAQLLGAHGIDSGRMYIEFRDVAAQNMGYNGATFAG